MDHPRRDVPVSFRVSPRARERIRKLAEDLGIPQAAVVEMGAELLARLTRADLVRLAARAKKDDEPG